MSYDVVPDQQGQAEHLRMLCSFTVCTFEHCMSNRSSKVPFSKAGGQYLRILKRNFGANSTGPLTTQQWDDKSTQL